MKLITYRFGEIDYSVEQEIIFNEGIPGFEHLKRYIMIDDEDSSSPFSYLQSIEEGEISFIVANPYQFLSNYEPELSKACFEKLGRVEDECVVLGIVVIPEKIQEASINLQAPIIINLKTRKGMQVILQDDKYQIRHQLMALLQEEAEKTC